MDNPKELIGMLQAISVVAKNLAEKIMRIDKEIDEYESHHPGKSTDQKKEERK